MTIAQGNPADILRPPLILSSFDKEKMNPAIVAFDIASYEEVLALWRRCKGVGLSDADSKKAIEAYLERNPEMSFVAKGGGEIVGAIFIFNNNTSGIAFWESIGWTYRTDINVISKIM
jgi:N-acetylglutamate synthase